jgi:hypothetical protein
MHTSSRNFRTSLFAAVLAAATLSPAIHAQSTGVRAEARIPFAFEVGSAHFEAGSYSISNLAETILSVRGGSHAAMAIARRESSLNLAKSSKAVFRKYGDNYFLAEVWSQGEVDHVIVVKSKAEESARKTQPTTASIAPESQIEVALLQAHK